MSFKVLNLKTIISLVLTLAIAIAFQNCGSSNSSSGGGITSESAKNVGIGHNGNGDGYLKADGTYINTASQGQCGDSTDASIVVVEKGKAQLIRENCQDIAPREITAKIDAREYNSEVLFFGNKLFEKKPPGKTPFSEVVCRGVAQTDPDGTVSYADVSLAAVGKETLFQGRTAAVYGGIIKTGSYNALNELIFAQQEPAELVLKDIAVDGRVAYRFIKEVDPMSTQSTPSQLREQDSYFLLVAKNGKGEFFYASEKSGIHYAIRTMNCYHH